MQLFYSEKLDNEVFTFNESESKHIVKVLRHNKGDIIQVTDGCGHMYNAQILIADPVECRASLKNSIPTADKRNYYLHIAIAPTKNNERIEFFVEKAVELGIDEISPLICEHSERKRININRLEKIAVSAMKQSFKSTLTKINEPISFREFINTDFVGKKLIAYIQRDSANTDFALNYSKNENALILVGPEGDFSKEEIEMASRNNFRLVSLGKSRLRTETAGITACCWVYYINQ